MKIGEEIQKVFRDLIGLKAWRPAIGWGGFVTIEFGDKRLVNHHYHGEWHLWLYQCEWELYSNSRQLAHSEVGKHVMKLAIDNLDNKKFLGVQFHADSMVTEFIFDSKLRLVCRPYDDATEDEEFWLL